MKVLAPFISCVCDEEEFTEELMNQFSEIYIITANGYLRHQRLSNNRYVRMSVDSLPVYASKEKEIEAELNFLPEGKKIPIIFLKQITKFFRDVIETKKSNYEAHCFVLWNKVKGYYISVPKQVVSGAAVTFSYGFDTLPEGDIIVLDMHSHNNMNAFFSGTDDRSDSIGTYYSGVIGYLNKPVPAMVFRFNFRDIKQTATIEEIFETPEEEEVVTDPGWLNQVEIRTATPPTTNFGIAGFGRHLPGNLDPRTPAFPKSWENGLNHDKDFYEDYSSMYSAKDYGFDALTVIPSLDAEMEESDLEFEDPDDTVTEISSLLDTLEGQDEHIQDVIREAFGLLSSEAQDSYATHGMH